MIGIALSVAVIAGLVQRLVPNVRPGAATWPLTHLSNQMPAADETTRRAAEHLFLLFPTIPPWPRSVHGGNQVTVQNLGSCGGLSLPRPIFLGVFHPHQVVLTRVNAGAYACLDEVGDGDGNQHNNNADDYHRFGKSHAAGTAQTKDHDTQCSWAAFVRQVDSRSLPPQPQPT